MSEKVTYEIFPDDSQAGLLRFIQALLGFDGELVSHYRGATLVAKIRAAPEKSEDFALTCGGTRPCDMHYRSPTEFVDGSMQALYASPAEELAARKVKPGALKWVVELQSGAWMPLLPDGNLEVTQSIEHARQYKSEHAATIALGIARRYQPFATAEVYEVETTVRRLRTVTIEELED